MAFLLSGTTMETGNLTKSLIDQGKSQRHFREFFECKGEGLTFLSPGWTAAAGAYVCTSWHKFKI